MSVGANTGALVRLTERGNLVMVMADAISMLNQRQIVSVSPDSSVHPLQNSLLTSLALASDMTDAEVKEQYARCQRGWVDKLPLSISYSYGQ